MCKCSWIWHLRSLNIETGVSRSLFHDLWGAKDSLSECVKSRWSLEWICIVHMAQPCQRQMPQRMGSWQATHQLKLHSQSEAEPWSTSKRQDPAVRPCLIWCRPLSSPARYHIFGAETLESARDSTHYLHSLLYPLELTPPSICSLRSLGFVHGWCLSSSLHTGPFLPLLFFTQDLKLGWREWGSHTAVCQGDIICPCFPRLGRTQWPELSPQHPHLIT